MGMPSLGTEIIFRNRMIPAGHDADDPLIVNPQIQTAAATAVTTDCHHITHGPTPISLPEHSSYNGYIHNEFYASVFPDTTINF